MSLLRGWMSVMMLLLALEMSTLFILFHFSFALFCMSSWNNNSYFKIAGVIHIFLFKLVLSSILWNLCSFCFKRYRIAQNQNSILWWKLKYLYTIYNMINYILPETLWWCFASLRWVNLMYLILQILTHDRCLCKRYFAEQ